MTFPQAIASQEVIEGQQFFRLYTELQSGGDIYEVDTSALAFVIGPQSDLARVRVTYYDPSAPNQVTSFVVSVDDPFIGRVDALGNTQYPVSKAPARILVTPEDLYEPLALAELAGSFEQTVAPVRMDLLSYLSPPTAVPGKRADYIVSGRITIPDSGDGTGGVQLALPYYRRKYAAINMGNFTPDDYTYSILGVSFTTDKSGASYQTLVTQLAAGTFNNSAFAETAEIKASTDGMWDFLTIQLSGPDVDSSTTQDCLKYRIVFTDEEV